MPLKFYARATTNPQDAKKTTRYMAQTVLDGKVDQQTIIDRIIAKSSLSEGDVLSCITELFNELTSELLEGHSVKLDNFGTFSLSISSKSQETAEKVTANCIESVHLRFHPSTRWYNNVKPRVRFQKVAAPGDGSGSGSAASGGGDDESTRGDGGEMEG